MIAGMIMSKFKEVVGERFGRLVVLEENHTPGTNRRVNCECDCGEIKTAILLSHLRSGKIVSCGCYRVERVREVNKELNTRHGMYGTRPYRIWDGIMDRTIRCRQEHRDWESYAGRGITCDDKWKTFEGFWEDMEEGYSENLELDRINVNGNYTKDNCRWADKAVQAFNKRKLKRNTSGRTGVVWDKNKSKWIATISKGGVAYYLGLFSDFQDAVKARQEGELKYYGEIKNE